MSADLDAFFRPSSIAVVGVSRDRRQLQPSAPRLPPPVRRIRVSSFGVNPSLEEADGVRCCSHAARRRSTGRPRPRVHAGRSRRRRRHRRREHRRTRRDRVLVGLRRGRRRRTRAPETPSATSPAARGCGCSVPTVRASSTCRRGRSPASPTRPAALDLHRVGRVAYVGQSGAVGGAMFDLAARARVDARGVGEHRQPGRRRRHRGGQLRPARPRGRRHPRLRRADARRRGVGRARSRRHGGGQADRGAASGATAAGRRAMLSHTGALVGERRPFELTSQANGIVMVDDLEPMIDVALARHGGAHRAGRRLAIITTSGGAGRPRRRLVRAVRLAGLGACAGHRGTRSTQLLPDFASSVNPIDVTGMFVEARPEPHGRAVRRRVARRRCRSRAPGAHQHRGRGGAAAGAVDRGRPHARWTTPLSVVYLAAADRTVDVREIMTDAGLPVFRGVAAALARHRHARAPGGPAPVVARRRLRRPDARACSPSCRRSTAARCSKRSGSPCPASILVDSAAEAEQAARALGGTVVLKVQSPDVLHKSDVGAIALGRAARRRGRGLRRARRVESDSVAPAAYPRRAGPGAGRCRGRAARRRAGRDGGYRPVLTVGIGGTAVEIYGDIANALAPVDARAGARVVALTSRAGRCSTGSAAARAVDVEAAARAIAARSRARRSLRRHARRPRSEPAHRARAAVCTRSTSCAGFGARAR